MSAFNEIDHIVVLMLENRSFDSLLGRLYPKSAAFEGLSGSELNLDSAGERVAVWNQAGTDPDTMSIPSPDPGELFSDINEQIFGVPAPASDAIANMSGFVRNYQRQATADSSAGSFLPQAVMHYFTTDQVPIISLLARQFAVCDQWHASAPCQTWPNRFFVHTGTADGYDNNSLLHVPYEMPTIFTRFGNEDTWRIYFHDTAQSLSLGDLWPHLGQFRLYAQFRQDAARGTLPSYAFIEPRYFPDLELPNDEHPPHVVSLGEELIADVYNAVRSGPAWNQTLLVITFDEHGGCYDHVSPPPATPPKTPAPGQAFAFDRYGVRVPAVLISPHIGQGTIVRAPAGGPPFDHTSIIATLRQRFSLGAPLTSRDAAAPTLESALGMPSPDNQGPPRVDAVPYGSSPSEVARARRAPVNDMQRALTRLAARLPALSSDVQLTDQISAHLANLRTGVLPEPSSDDLKDRGSAIRFIKQRLEALFAGVPLH